MDIDLKVVSYKLIQHWMQDFQKHSKCYEMPPETATSVGIYRNDELIGYFIVQGYAKKTLVINQGYLKNNYRHFNLSIKCLQALEGMCKQYGYKEIKLCTHNRFKSYIDFMRQMDFKPEKLIFSKQVV